MVRRVLPSDSYAGRTEIEELVDELDELGGDGLAEDVVADDLGQAGQLPQPFDVVRVLHEPDIEDESASSGTPNLNPKLMSWTMKPSPARRDRSGG